MTRQGTANIGLTYEDDKSKTFSYDNDIKNNMVTIDSEIGSAKNRLSDIENNTELPQFTSLLAQDSSIFSAGSGRDELGVEVDLSDNIVKGQVSAESIKGQSVYQIVKNGNFQEGTTDWVAGNSTLSAINNIMSVTGTGASAYPYTSQTIEQLKTVGHKTFVRAKVRVTNPDCSRIWGYVTGGVQDNYIVLDNPVQNTWYTVYGIAERSIGADSGIFLLRHDYADATTANGKVMEIQEVMLIDLTAHGLDSLTADEANARFPYWLKFGAKSTVSTRVKGVGKNLFDGPRIARDNPSLANSTFNSANNEYYADFSFTNFFQYPVIKLTPNTQHILSFTHEGTYNFRIYDITGTLVSASLSFTTNDQTDYILLLTNGDGVTNPFFNVQLERGSVATTFEEYQESTQYINATDSNGNTIELASLTNNTKDEVSGNKLYKMTQKKTLQSVDITILGTNWANVDYWNWNPTDGNFNASNLSNILTSTGRSLINYDTATTNTNAIMQSTNGYYFTFPKGMLLVDVQNTLDGAMCIYQLTNPKEIKINTTPLTCYPKGTITIEPFMYKRFSYNNGITWTIPVSEIEEIKKISTGEVITDYTLSNDGLSVTINSASNGEEYTIKAPIRREESTIPTTVMSYPTNINAANKSNVDAINELSRMVSELLIEQ